MYEACNTNDTSPEAKQVQLELIRRMSPSDRLQKTLDLSCELIRMSKAAIRRRYPEFTEDDVRIKFIELNYGNELAEKVKAWRQGEAVV